MILKCLPILLVVANIYALTEENIFEFISSQHFQNVFHDNGEIPGAKYEFVSPRRLDHNGYEVHKFARSNDLPNQIFYSLKAFDQEFKLDLVRADGVNTDDMVVVERNGDKELPLFKGSFENCFYEGKLTSHNNRRVALSACHGLMGLISTTDVHYLIRPLPEKLRNKRSIDSHDHIIYKINNNATFKWGNDAVIKNPLPKDFYERSKRQAQGASNAQTLIVESAIFIDSGLTSHYRSVYSQSVNTELLRYYLLVFSTIQYIYNNGGLGKKFKFIVVKFEIIVNNPPTLRRDNNAHSYLNSFCAWQDRLNVKNDNDPNHWDHGFLFTELSMHIAVPQHMAALGVCALGKLCKSDESCSLNTGKGVVAIFTAAHELGHNFGMNHEGENNNCKPGDYVMTAGDYITPFSSCSRQEFYGYITDPLSSCLLDDRPGPQNLNHEQYRDWIGTIYDMDSQCKLSHGTQYSYPRFLAQDTLCDILWCVDRNNQYVNGPTYALEGSNCGPRMWCIKKKCVPARY